MLHHTGSHCSRQPHHNNVAKATKRDVDAGDDVPSRVVPLQDGCLDNWSWDPWAKSHEVRICDNDHLVVKFHPNWSNGTAAARGNTVLNYGVHYWQISTNRVFGTSMMFGIGTKHARLHVNAFVNILGEDNQSWGLSHKGYLWHDGKWKQYTRPFLEAGPTTIGVLFDWYKGTLSFYQEGECLGVAFRGLNIQDELYPIVASTAAKTEMTLDIRLRNFDCLQDRCRSVIAQYCHNNNTDELPLPTTLRNYIKEVLYGHKSTGHHF